MNNLNRFAITLFSMSAVQLGHTKSFWDLRSFYSTIAIDSHCANVNKVALGVVFHHSNQHVFGGESVVGVGVVNSLD